MLVNFKLIIITPEKHIVGEAEVINKLFNAELEILHIRKPGHTIEDMRNLINSIPAAFHSQLVIHNHYELLNEFNLKGIHLPEKTRLDSNTKQIKSIVSTSFHNLEDILASKPIFEYAFFSPVFQSISKKGYKPMIELNRLENFFEINKNHIPFTIIALGGISDQNILEIRNTGFGGAACIGYIWENPDPVKHFKKLRKILQI